MPEESKLHELMVADANSGFEDMQGQDFSAPFLIICQANSPYVNENHELYLPDARPGRIINTQNNKVYREVRIIPCRYQFKTVEWKANRGGFVASYDRGQEPDDLENDPLRPNQIKRVNGNVMQQTAYYLALLLETIKDDNDEDHLWSTERVIIPLYSTQLKKSRRWNSQMSGYKIEGTDKMMPMFGNIYRLSTVSESNSQGTWYGWKIEWESEVTNPRLYSSAKEVNQITNFLPERLIASMKQHEDEEGTM